MEAFNQSHKRSAPCSAPRTRKAHVIVVGKRGTNDVEGTASTTSRLDQALRKKKIFALGAARCATAIYPSPNLGLTRWANTARFLSHGLVPKSGCCPNTHKQEELIKRITRGSCYIFKVSAALWPNAVSSNVELKLVQTSWRQRKACFSVLQRYGQLSPTLSFKFNIAGQAIDW